MRFVRLTSVAFIACLAVLAIASSQIATAQQKKVEPVTLPVGETVNLVHTGMGSQLTGQLIAQVRDWLVVKVGTVKLWVSRLQVVYVEHPARAATPVPIPAPAPAPR
jgi:hypothetical protein